jgi:hypothetical protein
MYGVEIFTRRVGGKGIMPRRIDAWTAISESDWPFSQAAPSAIHEYELHLALENIDHTRTGAEPQTNGICERFHKTVLNEFYWVAFRKKLYSRGPAGGPRRLASGVQRGPAASGPVVLRQDVEADLPGHRPGGGCSRSSVALPGRVSSETSISSSRKCCFWAAARPWARKSRGLDTWADRALISGHSNVAPRGLPHHAGRRAIGERVGSARPSVVAAPLRAWPPSSQRLTTIPRAAHHPILPGGFSVHPGQGGDHDAARRKRAREGTHAPSRVPGGQVG